MNKIRRIVFTIAFCTIVAGCNGQNQNAVQNRSNNTHRVGGDCEAGYCELMYVGMPKEINSVDTSAGWFEKGQKLVITGKVFQVDGKSPAPNVIVYYHHTDNEGYYSTRNDKPENQTRHGHIRGWVKSDANGKYTIYTNRPAPYPGQELPAHIHWLIKEPDIDNEYWIDDLVFDDDKLLTQYRRNNSFENRGGSGIVRISSKNDLQTANHVIVLGLNIPYYPK